MPDYIKCFTSVMKAVNNGFPMSIDSAMASVSNNDTHVGEVSFVKPHCNLFCATSNMFCIKFKWTFFNTFPQYTCYCDTSIGIWIKCWFSLLFVKRVICPSLKTLVILPLFIMSLKVYLLLSLV